MNITIVVWRASRPWLRPACLVLMPAAVLIFMACGGSDSKPAASTTQAAGGQAQQGSAAAQGTTGTGGVAAQPSAAPASAAPASAGKLDPCALLTKAAAEAAAGEPLKDGEPKDSGNPIGQQLCGYAAVSERSGRLVQLSIVTDGGMSKELKDRKYTAKQLFSDSRAGAASVPGVGEDAYMRGTAFLNVLQRDVTFTVSVTGGAIGQSDKPVTPESLAALARTVLERLPR